MKTMVTTMPKITWNCVFVYTHCTMYTHFKWMGKCLMEYWWIAGVQSLKWLWLKAMLEWVDVINDLPFFIQYIKRNVKFDWNDLISCHCLTIHVNAYAICASRPLSCNTTGLKQTKICFISVSVRSSSACVFFSPHFFDIVVFVFALVKKIKETQLPFILCLLLNVHSVVVIVVDLWVYLLTVTVYYQFIV